MTIAYIAAYTLVVVLGVEGQLEAVIAAPIAARAALVVLGLEDFIGQGRAGLNVQGISQSESDKQCTSP